MNLEPTKMTTHHQSLAQLDEQRAPQLLEEPSKTQQPDDVVHVETGSSRSTETCQNDSDGNDKVINNDGSSLQGRSPSAAPVVADDVTKEARRADELLEDDNGRERLKRHRIEVAASRVCIPDVWGQEELLKDWIDCSAFDDSLAPTGSIMSARAALVEERRRSNSGGFRIQNRC